MIHEETKNFLETLKEQLLKSSKQKLFFLLIGRTGVGKSSTVNTLMGKQIAQVGDYEPTTMGIESYDSTINGIQFTIIDTPGLCDELEEAGNDHHYLELMRSKVHQVDLMWFVSRLDETRVSSDEKKGIKLISEAFSPKIWESAVIVFTFANAVNAETYPVALQKRTELIQKEIAKYTSDEIAFNIPSVAVDNKSLITPDGQKWLEELYTKVFFRMSKRGIMPFLMATAPRIKTSQHHKTSHEPNWRFYNQSVSNEEENIENHQSTDVGFDFNEQQKQVIKTTIIGAIPALAIAGATVGSSFGPIGTVIGGAVGVTIGAIFYFFES